MVAVPVLQDGGVGVELGIRDEVLPQQAVVRVVLRLDGLRDDAPLRGVPQPVSDRPDASRHEAEHSGLTRQ